MKARLVTDGVYYAYLRLPLGQLASLTRRLRRRRRILGRGGRHDGGSLVRHLLRGHRLGMRLPIDLFLRLHLANRDALVGVICHVLLLLRLELGQRRLCQLGAHAVADQARLQRLLRRGDRRRQVGAQPTLLLVRILKSTLELNIRLLRPDGRGRSERLLQFGQSLRLLLETLLERGELVLELLELIEARREHRRLLVDRQVLWHVDLRPRRVESIQRVLCAVGIVLLEHLANGGDSARVHHKHAAHVARLLAALATLQSDRGRACRLEARLLQRLSGQPRPIGRGTGCLGRQRCGERRVVSVY